jgi:prolipoprotein diacylglyceryltransferase
MILFITLWLLAGVASVVHLFFVMRRSLVREYPELFKMSDSLFKFWKDDPEHMVIALLAILVGPLGFIVTYNAMPKDFFK